MALSNPYLKKTLLDLKLDDNLLDRPRSPIYEASSRDDDYMEDADAWMEDSLEEQAMNHQFEEPDDMAPEPAPPEDDVSIEPSIDREEASSPPPSPARVRLFHQPKNSPPAFESFNGNNWRTVNRHQVSSPSMKASAWKCTDATPRITKNPEVKKSLTQSAPDAQLLEFSARRFRFEYSSHAYRPTIRCRKTLTTPQPGMHCYPMTLGDGSRVYIPTRKDHSKPTKQNSSNNTLNPLGVSMTELLRRVEVAQRWKATHSANLDQDRDQKHPSKDQANRLWVDKHAPKVFVDLLSDERTNREVLKALRAWDAHVFGRGRKPSVKDSRPDESSRVILLSGTPGVGKTTLAHILCRHAGYRALEVNGSDERSASVLREHVVRTMESNTLHGSGKPNALILDEIDGADAKHAIQSIVDIIRADPSKKHPYLRRPIIFICNNKYAPALKPLLPFAKHFEVRAPSQSRLVARLSAVLAAEQLTASNSALHQLVTTSGGDIRSCLYSLQFAATKAREERSEAVMLDISKALDANLNGDGLKDERKDLAGTITAVFRRNTVSKKKTPSDLCERQSASMRVADTVHTYGDNSRVLDYLFLNIMYVSYIDPTFDRCAIIHEWLSSGCLFNNRQDLESLHLPTTAGATHLLCRVEQRPDLEFSLREVFDAKYQFETNQALIQKFAEGLQNNARKSTATLATETIPFAMWILSAGQGSGSLTRVVSSKKVLHDDEQAAFDAHAGVLRSLGLTYKQDSSDAYQRNSSGDAPLILDPPIQRIVQFRDLNMPHGASRSDIPPALKEILAEQANADRIRFRGSKMADPISPSKFVAAPREEVHVLYTPSASKRPITGKLDPESSSKKPKVVTATNFLGIQAKKAKASRSAKAAARVGVLRSSNSRKLSHTGSGVPLDSVVRLKFVKGFSSAVRKPCHLEDLV